MFDFTQIPYLSLALFPLVIVVFWLLYRGGQKNKKQQSSLSSEYFKGLNYLLNDEQGKALDVFIKLVESNWDTIDTHFALGKIYRKNGEIDKAIKIHQGLIGRPSLPEQYRSKILLELGFDYLGAGWLDRAEGLFKEVLIVDPQSPAAREKLIFIYQQEKDWYRAIDIAIELCKKNPVEIGPMIAQYYCELAEMASTKGNIVQMVGNAEKALGYDTACARASILLADQKRREGNDRSAIQHYQRIESQDPESMTLVLESMLTCYTRLSALEEFYDYLSALEQRNEKIFLQTTIAEVLEQIKGKQPAIEYLSEKLKEHPSLEGIRKLLSYRKVDFNIEHIYDDMNIAVGMMQKERMHYRCRACGFNTNTHYWLCPGCNHWARIKPSLGEICKIKTIKVEDNKE